MTNISPRCYIYLMASVLQYYCIIFWTSQQLTQFKGDSSLILSIRFVGVHHEVSVPIVSSRG